MLLLTLLPACARQPYLRWHGGDAFGVFEAQGRAPYRIECPGTMGDRFACLAARMRERLGERSNALAVVADDGSLLKTSTTEHGQAVPTTTATVFPLLSVTKMFTAATAVLLAQEGILDLHRPIASYLSELDANAELAAVTLHQLLTHTAGLVDDPRKRAGQCEGGGQLSDAIARAHLGARAGAVYLYSNIGYALAGLVIERRTSQPFEEVVRQRVLLPMGMHRATFDFAAVQVRGHPEGAGAGSRCRLMAPAGGLNASARDLAQWARAMSEPSTHPLGEPLALALTKPYVETGARPDEAYGYGVDMIHRGDIWVYNHSGGVPDFSAFVAWVPARRLGVAAMMNATNTAGATPSAIVLRTLSVLLDLPVDWRAHTEGSPRPSSAYVGTYVDRKSWLGRLRVRLDGQGRLAFDYPDGPPPLLPPTFVFRFVPGEEQARFVVTAVGVGERAADE
jgi:CubicO group peptidase (beta-lactamase class C family)